MSLSALKTNYDDKFGFYVYDDNEELITLDEFIRYAKYDIPYHIGGILDYHF